MATHWSGDNSNDDYFVSLGSTSRLVFSLASLRWISKECLLRFLLSLWGWCYCPYLPILHPGSPLRNVFKQYISPLSFRMWRLDWLVWLALSYLELTLSNNVKAYFILFLSQADGPIVMSPSTRKYVLLVRMSSRLHKIDEKKNVDGFWFPHFGSLGKTGSCGSQAPITGSGAIWPICVTHVHVWLVELKWLFHCSLYALTLLALFQLIVSS